MYTEMPSRPGLPSHRNVRAAKSCHHQPSLSAHHDARTRLHWGNRCEFAGPPDVQLTSTICGLDSLHGRRAGGAGMTYLATRHSSRCSNCPPSRHTVCLG